MLFLRIYHRECRNGGYQIDLFSFWNYLTIPGSFEENTARMLPHMVGGIGSVIHVLIFIVFVVSVVSLSCLVVFDNKIYVHTLPFHLAVCIIWFSRWYKKLRHVINNPVDMMRASGSWSNFLERPIRRLRPCEFCHIYTQVHIHLFVTQFQKNNYGIF